MAGEHRIRYDESGRVVCPDRVEVGFIEGDGVGPDIWAATRPVIEAAVEAAYGGRRAIIWVELLAGEKARALRGDDLPDETFDRLRTLGVGLKGPLTTPVGGGFRSLNVTLRQRLDLYACVRPVKHIPGVPSPVKRPELVDMVVFRENTEDVYAGLEWPAGSPEADRLIDLIGREFGGLIAPGSGVGVKPMSRPATERLVRMAMKYALEDGRRSLTLVHKGNIMKHTEGAFARWGYDLCAREFADASVPEAEVQARYGGEAPDGVVVVKDRIADAMFQQVLLRPAEYEVIATPNLNGDYLSDALAAQVGGLGLAPGANIGDKCALFEATHGTAPKYAGLDKINPGSLILSGALLLDHLGWAEAAAAVRTALAQIVSAKTVTYDLARQLDGAREVLCSEFGRLIVERLRS
ncbi:MAG: NADP-dependent isocitrate dehydrogenase [Proteobacteria bacterium]|nr:NADP-dependent isocitrate dehydrogenase [Pseudomonadota bacterium]MBU1741149.1 NADP-dependent isocitrate dehydrogenase [Pseudomonadota bacterium]